jgi:hypothetical protein
MRVNSQFASMPTATIKTVKAQAGAPTTIHTKAGGERRC